ncbi:YybH family protein [Spongiimicrobium salis]|uniref:YybH family protein n=1 Tax=Spongiimicrobium salis TaxID=1667022 RepID=UPI00374D5DF8
MNKKGTVRKAAYPRQIADVVSAYLEEGDIEGILTLFHPECMVCFPPEEPPKKGIEAIRTLFSPFVEERARLKSTVIGELIHGDLALLQANWKIEDSKGNVMAEGSSTEVAKQKEDGSWVYYLDCPYGLPGGVIG